MKTEIILKLFKYNIFITCDFFFTFIASVISHLAPCANFMTEVAMYGKGDVYIFQAEIFKVNRRILVWIAPKNMTKLNILGIYTSNPIFKILHLII